MELKDIMNSGIEAIKSASTLDKLNDVRIEYLSKKGHLTQVMGQMKSLPNEEKPLFGKKVNEVKQEIEVALKEKQEELQELQLLEQMKEDKIDVS
ncbi:MAG: phenylalanine--tRNA ligase subunit alpha, partial [Erysipelothrix sp.]